MQSVSVSLVVVWKFWVSPTCVDLPGVSRLIVKVLLCVSSSDDILPPIVSCELSFNILLTSAVLIRFVLNELLIFTFSASQILRPLGEHANNKKNESILTADSAGFFIFFTLVISETPVNVGKATWKKALVLPLCMNFPEFSRCTNSAPLTFELPHLNDLELLERRKRVKWNGVRVTSYIIITRKSVANSRVSPDGAFPPLLIGPGANKHGSIAGSFDPGVNVDYIHPHQYAAVRGFLDQWEKGEAVRFNISGRFTDKTKTIPDIKFAFRSVSLFRPSIDS